MCGHESNLTDVFIRRRKLDGHESNLTDVLVRRGKLDTQEDTRGLHAERTHCVRTQQGGIHLQIKERGFRRYQT